MTEDHDLRILGRLAAAQQHQPAEDLDHEQVEQAEGHKPRSCRNRFIRPSRRSQYLWRVLNRYTRRHRRGVRRRHAEHVGDALEDWRGRRAGRRARLGRPSSRSYLRNGMLIRTDDIQATIATSKQRRPRCRRIYLLCTLRERRKV
jgi:hypothetical protein